MKNLVKREDLPTVREVHHGDMHYHLGILKEFIKDERMREFLPKDLPVSLAWVRLEQDEVLEKHTHPVDSMILICQGTGRSFGELECSLEEGDAVLVRAGHAHGFVGGAPVGFWGLSLQFEARGLYEDLDDPWVSFKDHESHNIDAAACTSAAALLSRNEELTDRFCKHRIFTAAERGALDDVAARERLLDCLQVWLSHLKQCPRSVRPPAAIDAALEELEAVLRASGERKPIRDASLEALCAWSLWKIGSASPAERRVLTSLVADRALVIACRGLLPRLGSARALPEIGAEEWNRLASALQVEGTPDWSRLARLQREAWDNTTALLGRIATLVLR